MIKHIEHIRKTTPMLKSDFCIFVCRCGSAADTQALTGYVINYLTQHQVELGEAPSVKTAANLFKLIAYNNKDRLLLNPGFNVSEIVFV